MEAVIDMQQNTTIFQNKLYQFWLRDYVYMGVHFLYVKLYIS